MFILLSSSKGNEQPFVLRFRSKWLWFEQGCKAIAASMVCICSVLSQWDLHVEFKKGTTGQLCCCCIVVHKQVLCEAVCSFCGCMVKHTECIEGLFSGGFHSEKRYGHEEMKIWFMAKHSQKRKLVRSLLGPLLIIY